MYFDEGINHYGQISPEEPRLGPDGSIYVQTLACGLERITGIDTNAPKSQLVYLFAASYCGVPTIVGHYLLQSVSYLHSVIVLDLSNGAKPLEVSRLKIDDNFYPHWTGWDAKTHRVVVTTGGTGDPRLYMLKFDPASGSLALDDAFRDADGKPGLNFSDRTWPHSWKGTGVPHGVVFSR